MRRAKRGTAAACKSAVLSTLLTSRDPVHLREDWADQARYSENWEEIVYHRGGGEPEHVDYTATVSPGTLALDRRTPKNSTSLASRFDIPGAGDRCCIHRFRVALTYTPPEGNRGCGSGFMLGESPEETSSLLLVYIAYENGSFELRWDADTGHTLKTVPTQHTFLVDATLDWRTGMARVTVDGAELERPVPFRPVPVSVIYFKAGAYPGQSTLGPFDVWHFNRPLPDSIRFEGER